MTHVFNGLKRLQNFIDLSILIHGTNNSPTSARIGSEIGTRCSSWNTIESPSSVETFRWLTRNERCVRTKSSAGNRFSRVDKVWQVRKTWVGVTIFMALPCDSKNKTSDRWTRCNKRESEHAVVHVVA